MLDSLFGHGSNLKMFFFFNIHFFVSLKIELICSESENAFDVQRFHIKHRAKTYHTSLLISSYKSKINLHI